jgi:replicative DNA helicase
MAKQDSGEKLNKNLSERSLPADINAEAAILSAMLIDSDVVSKGIEKIKEEFFYRNAHNIFTAHASALNESIEIDPLTRINRLERNNLRKRLAASHTSMKSPISLFQANFDYT